MASNPGDLVLDRLGAAAQRDLRQDGQARREPHVPGLAGVDPLEVYSLV
jgi:hypothetical protein